MAKKPVTAEELRAQLAEIENASEVAKLKAEIARLTQENASLTAQRDTITKQHRQVEKDMESVVEVVRTYDRRSRPTNRMGAEDDARVVASQRFASAYVRAGVAKGTHDPATGLPFTDETRPVRDMSAGTLKVSKGELERVFPQLACASVKVSEAEAAAVIDVDVGAHTTQEIAGA